MLVYTIHVFWWPIQSTKRYHQIELNHVFVWPKSLIASQAQGNWSLISCDQISLNWTEIASSFCIAIDQPSLPTLFPPPPCSFQSRSQSQQQQSCPLLCIWADSFQSFGFSPLQSLDICEMTRMQWTGSFRPSQNQLQFEEPSLKF